MIRNHPKSWLFSMTTQPMWHSELLGPYFVMGAIYSGVAALIVGLALLVPAFNLTGQWGLATILVITSFVGVSLLGLWLIFSIWRSRK